MTEVVVVRFSVIASLALAWVAGCSPSRHTTTIELGERFRPLERIREANVPGLAAGMVATIYSEVLTKDLGALLDAYAEGSVEFDALLFHEREHAVREIADPTFLPRYALNAGFRWQEEKVGWAKEIAYLRVHGRTIGVDWITGVLSGPAYHNMTTPEIARAWLLEQVTR